jgi:hypothetical protein
MGDTHLLEGPRSALARFIRGVTASAPGQPGVWAERGATGTSQAARRRTRRDTAALGCRQPCDRARFAEAIPLFGEVPNHEPITTSADRRTRGGTTGDCRGVRGGSGRGGGHGRLRSLAWRRRSCRARHPPARCTSSASQPRRPAVTTTPGTRSSAQSPWRAAPARRDRH